jgi:hypothetical protein
MLLCLAKTHRKGAPKELKRASVLNFRIAVRVSNQPNNTIGSYSTTKGKSMSTSSSQLLFKKIR